MITWKIQPQEREGDYFFSGEKYMTKKVFNELSFFEVSQIYSQILAIVKKNNGADYLFVFKDKQERTLFLIDNLPNIKKHGKGKEHNYSTLMFAEEY